MGQINSYDLSKFGPLATSFLEMHKPMTEFGEWLIDDDGFHFKNFITVLEKKASDESILQADISKELEHYPHRKLVEEKFQLSNLYAGRTFGKRVELLFENLDYDYSDWPQKSRDIRFACVSMLGHIEDFFVPKSKEGQKAHPKTRLRWMKMFIDILENEHGLLNMFTDVLYEICTTIQPNVTVEEDPTALSNRCLELHVGKDTVRMRADNTILKKQLDTILWKDYVPGFASKKGNRVPAIELLESFRKSPTRNLIQVLGEGGLGKTKLVIEFLKKCLDQEDSTKEFDSVLMLTAKSVSQGEWNTNFGTLNHESLLSPRDPTLAFGHYIPNMDYEDTMEYIYNFAEVTHNDRKALELKMNHQRYLIILDNFEDTQEHDLEKFADFFEHFIDFEDCKSKIIITGRTESDYTSDIPMLKLQRLTDEQAVDLMKKRYQYQFEQYYSRADTRGEQTAIFDDFNASISKDLIRRIKDEVEKQDADLAAHYWDGILHPGVLFYFISMIMDGKLYTECKDQFGPKVSFEQVFTYAVCHEKFGVNEYHKSWEKWIKDKTTLYIKNDPHCLKILQVMSEQPESFFNIILLQDHLPNVSKDSLMLAFDKLQSHQGILELNLEEGTYRISRDSITRYGLENKKEPTQDIFSQLQKHYEYPELLAQKLPKIIADTKGDITVDEFQALTHSVHKISTDKNFYSYTEKSLLELDSLFERIYRVCIPSEDWSIAELNEFADQCKKIKFSNQNKKQLIERAISFIESDSELAYQAMQGRVSNLPKYFLLFLSLSQSQANFFSKLKSYSVPFYHRSQSPRMFRDTVHRLFCSTEPSDLNREDFSRMLQFAPLLVKDFEQLQEFSSWFIASFSQLYDFTDVESLGDIENISKYVKQLVSRNYVRSKLQISISTVAMYDYYEALDHLQVEYGIESELKQKLPFTEIVKGEQEITIEQATPDIVHSFYSIEDSRIDFNPDLRCILTGSTPELKMYKYRLIDLPVPDQKKNELINRTPNESRLDELRQRSESVTSNTTSAKSIDFGSIQVTPSIDDSPSVDPLTRLREQIVTELSRETRNHIFLKDFSDQFFEVIPEQTTIELYKFIRDNLGEILGIVNSKLSDHQQPWEIKRSPYRKDFITAIERGKTEVNHDSSPLNGVPSSGDSEGIVWFERKKAGMIADVSLAINTIKEMKPKLVDHHNHRGNFNTPAAFATAFVKTFKRPYSKYKTTSMRWYAAFHSHYSSTPPLECDILDAYEKELRRLLKREKMSHRSGQKVWTFCEHWLMKLRSNFGCSTRTFAEREQQKKRERKREDIARQNERQMKRDETRRKKELLRQRLKQEEELAENERVRKSTVQSISMELTSMVGVSPNRSKQIDLIIEAIRISIIESASYEKSNKTFSQWFSGFYTSPSTHAKLFLHNFYSSLLAHIELKMFSDPTLEDEWLILWSYLETRGFNAEDIESFKTHANL